MSFKSDLKTAYKAASSDLGARMSNFIDFLWALISSSQCIHGQLISSVNTTLGRLTLACRVTYVYFLSLVGKHVLIKISLYFASAVVFLEFQTFFKNLKCLGSLQTLCYLHGCACDKNMLSSNTVMVWCF